jgi:Zn-dependent protease
VTPDFIRNVAIFVPALLLSLSVHEYAHAWTATRLGDRTAMQEGRLTLSPLSHIDPLGSLLFPLMILYATGVIFGWAKPVPFRPANFTRRVTMRQGAALTAIAGPASNVLLALLSAVALRILFELGAFGAGSSGHTTMVVRFLSAMFSLNVLLAVFNLFPLPPLDGSHLLPRSLDHVKETLSRYSFLLFVVLFFIPIPGLGSSLGHFILRPFMALLEHALLFIAGI